MLVQGLPSMAEGRYCTTRCGRLAATAFSRELNRFDEAMFCSSPIKIQPKLVAGWSSQPWTSATIAAVDPQVLAPKAVTWICALAVLVKSPPGVVQNSVLKNRCSQVASPVVAGPPPPPPDPTASEVPSPQSASTLCKLTGFAPTMVLFMFITS